MEQTVRNFESLIRSLNGNVDRHAIADGDADNFRTLQRFATEFTNNPTLENSRKYFLKLGFTGGVLKNSVKNYLRNNDVSEIQEDALNNILSSLEVAEISMNTVELAIIDIKATLRL